MATNTTRSELACIKRRLTAIEKRLNKLDGKGIREIGFLELKNMENPAAWEDDEEEFPPETKKKVRGFK